MANPYQTRSFIEPGEPRQIEVYDTRDGCGVKWFPMTAEGSRRAEEYAADLWIAEAAHAARPVYEPTAEEPAELVGEQWVCRGCSPVLVGEELAEECPDCGFRGNLRFGPCPGCAAEAAPAAARVTGANPLTPALVPSPEQIEAALFRLEEDARRAKECCEAAKDTEGAKIARRSERAYRDAAALLYQPDSYVVTFRGDVLVKSRSRGTVWHRVGRRPAAGGEWSPICCSCEWGTKGDGLGPCTHQGLYEGIEAAHEERIADADAAAVFGVAAD